ncbi:MAG: hypothetical protein GTN90_14875 [Xanthomonadales bacterium]|nr:hypothetical protein [Xanthomonadales bacterium]
MLGDEVDPDFMNHVQPHQMKRKYEVHARFDGLAADGRLVPKTRRLRLDALAEANGAARNAEIAEGTRRRVREGRASEERPG